MISVAYGGEDPANRPPSQHAARCYCGEVNGLFLIFDKFYCARHRPRGDARS